MTCLNPNTTEMAKSIFIQVFLSAPTSAPAPALAPAPAPKVSQEVYETTKIKEKTDTHSLKHNQEP